jgi:hypothetical protein
MKTEFALFLDDIREIDYNDQFNSFTNENNLHVFLARSSEEAKSIVLLNGCPSVVSFDHDLGGDDTAMDFIKWLIEMDMDDKDVIPNDFMYFIHSANPVGSANIDGILKSYMKHKAS